MLHVCALFSFNFGLFCFVFFLHLLLLIIRLMKAASTDGPSSLLAACPMFNIEMLYCKFVLLGELQEAQLMLTTGLTRLAISRGQQT